MPTGVELATAWVRIVPTTEGVQGELTDALGPAADKAGDTAGTRAGGKFSSAAKVAFAAAATAVAGVFVSTFNTGMDELKLGEQLNAVTGQYIANSDAHFAMGVQGVDDYTLALSRVSGISEEDLQAAGNEILKFGVVSDEQYQRAVASINDMGAAGKDVTSVSAALGKALADPASAAGKLARIGVVLTDAEKDQIDAMTKAGDTAGAQGVILDSLEVAYGGMAETVGETMTGKLNRMENAWQNTAANLVSLVLPALSWVADTLMTVAQWAEQNQGVVAVLAGVLGGVVAVAFYAWASAIWAANAALLANPITWIILAIVGLVAGLIWVATQTTFFQDAWTNVTTAIGVAWQWLWDNVLNPVFTAIGAIFTWLWNNIIYPVVLAVVVYIGIWAAIFTWLWESVLSPVIGFIAAAFSWLWANVIQPDIDFITDALNFLGVVFGLLWSTYVDPAIQAVGGALNWLWNTVISPVVGFISGAFDFLGNAVRTALGGVGDFVAHAFQSALDAVRGPVNGIIGLVNDAIRGLNTLSVTIPAWVPLVGGQTWGLSIPTIPMLADGGTITRSGTVLVGERGPELLNLPAGASVNPDIADAGGPSTLQVYDVDGVLLGSMRVAASKVVSNKSRDDAADLTTGYRRTG